MLGRLVIIKRNNVRRKKGNARFNFSHLTSYGSLIRPEVSHVGHLQLAFSGFEVLRLAEVVHSLLSGSFALGLPLIDKCAIPTAAGIL
jgi:hypothetical protein